MKKGISLIVLIITIIVVIILAGAVILNLSSTDIITNANTAVTESDTDAIASEKALFQGSMMLKYRAAYDDTLVIYSGTNESTPDGDWFYDLDGNGTATTGDTLQDLSVVPST